MLRPAFRSLRRNPGISAIATLLLALGIGANSAIFTLIDKILLTPLSVAQPDRLIAVSTSSDENPGGGTFYRISYEEYRQLHDESSVLSGLCAWRDEEQHVRLGAVTELVETEWVTGNYFDVLGLQPLRGRLITPRDERLSSAPVAVLSEQFWRRRFFGDTGIIGSTLELNGQPFVIAGITPPGFMGAENQPFQVSGGASSTGVPGIGRFPDIYIPLMLASPSSLEFSSWCATRDCLQPGGFALLLMGRVKPGITIAQAMSSIREQDRRVRLRLAESMSVDRYRQRYLAESLVVQPGARGLQIKQRYWEPSLWILMAATGLLLLIMCVNLAGLLLARAEGRAKETAIRAAIGASPWQLVKQFMAEALLLTGSAAIFGLLLAWWAGSALLAMVPAVNLDLSPDRRVLFFTIGVSLLSAVLYCVAPGVFISRTDPINALKGAHRSHRFGLRQGLIVAQIALSLVLLSGAGLFVRTLSNWRYRNSGQERAAVVDLSLWPVKPSAYSPEQWKQVLTGLTDRLRAIPGVQQVGLSARGNFWLGWGHGTDIEIVPRSDVSAVAGAVEVTPAFFDALRIPLLGGRLWTEDEGRRGASLAVVNQAFADRFFGQQNPVGHRVRLKLLQDSFEIVGVVRNVYHFNIRRQGAPTLVYVPARTWDDGAHLYVQAANGVESVQSVVRRIAQSYDANLGLYSSTTLEQEMDGFLLNERLLAWIAASLGGFAALLTAVGLFGLMAHVVARRTRDIAIRIALGARPDQAVRPVLRTASTLVGFGALLGLAASLLTTRLFRALIFGVSPTDSATILASTVLILVAGLVAACWPVRHALSITPTEALHIE